MDNLIEKVEKNEREEEEKEMEFSDDEEFQENIEMAKKESTNAATMMI